MVLDLFRKAPLLKNKPITGAVLRMARGDGILEFKGPCASTLKIYAAR